MSNYGKITKQELNPILVQELEQTGSDVTKLKKDVTDVSTQLANTDQQVISKGRQLNKDTAQSTRNTRTTIPFISVIDDDGMVGVITKLKPLMQSRNIPCGVALMGNSTVITNEDYRQQIVDLQNNDGWEVLSHTMEHGNLNQMTDQEIENDCVNYLNLMNGYGLNVKSIAYPWGQRGNLDIISKYYVAGFDTSNTHNSKPIDPYRIHRYALGSSMPAGQDTLAFFKGVIDSAITNNRWLVFMTHVDYPGNDMQIIQDVLDYAIAQGVKIGTPNEGLRHFAPIVYSGDRTNGDYYSIEQNGVIRTNKYLLNERLSTLLETDPPRTTTQTTYREVTGWSVGDGIVITHNAPTGYQYQVFMRTGINVNIWVRKWDGSAWRPWYKQINEQPQIVYTMPARTLTPGQTQNVTVTDSSIIATDMHIARPSGGLENGITWNVYSEGSGALRIRLQNISASDVTLAERTWVIKRLS